MNSNPDLKLFNHPPSSCKLQIRTKKSFPHRDEKQNTSRRGKTRKRRKVLWKLCMWFFVLHMLACIHVSDVACDWCNRTDCIDLYCSVRTGGLTRNLLDFLRENDRQSTAQVWTIDRKSGNGLFRENFPTQIIFIFTLRNFHYRSKKISLIKLPLAPPARRAEEKNPRAST